MVKGSRKVQQKNVLLEEIRHELKVVAEGHTDLNRKIDRVADELKGEIRQVDQKLDQHSRELLTRMDGFSQRFDALSKQMSEGFAQIAKLLTEFEKQLQHHVHVS